MRNLKWLIFVAALCITALIWFLAHRKSEPASLSQAPADSNASTTGATPVPPAGTPQPKSNASEPPAPARVVPEPEASVTPEEKSRGVVESKNVSVEFWGKVVDQNDAPLAGVKIESQIRHWDFISGSGAAQTKINAATTTDADGQFHIGGSSGDDLTLKIAKEGYELEPKAKLGFGYGLAEQFTARTDAPMIFKMWPTNIHESLVTGEKRFHIVPDGRAYVIDLAKGTIAETGQGDLRLWIKRPEQVALGQRYEWSCEIDAINGGGFLEETNFNSSMYSAPERGYLPVFSHQENVRSGWSDSTGMKRFYLKLDNGRQFGRMTVELFAYYNDKAPGLMEIHYAINPSGSRVLR